MKIVTKSVLSALILLFSITGFSQNKSSKTNPQKDIRVNKEYDKDGNLIRYDSTYVYTWSSDTGFHFQNDTSLFNNKEMDKMRKRIKEHMRQFFGNDSTCTKHFRHPFSSEDFFFHDFFNPNLFKKDFFHGDPNHDDFFMEFDKMMEEHMNFRNKHFREMHKNLDSLRYQFMEQQKKYFQKRDSIYRKYKNTSNKSVDT